MRVRQTDNSNTNVTLNVKGADSDLSPIKRHVLSHFVRQVKVPGFRAGKAPLELVEKHADQRLLTDEFMEHALNELFRKAVENEQLRPVGQPNVSLKKFVPYSELEFEASFDVIGPVRLPDYKSIKLAKPKIEVNAKEVNDVIDSLRSRMAERKAVERPSKAGDEVIIDFSAKDTGGKPVSGADGKDHPLILGSDSFIPGFEANIIGAKAGESKQFDLTFPSNYGIAALQGKKVTFDVNISKVHELELPKIDDSFASKVGLFKTIAELKTDIKKQLKLEKQQQADRDYENQIINQLTDKATVEIPPSLVEEQLLHMEEDEKRNLTYRGQTWQEHLDQEGIDEATHRDRQRPDAEQRVKAGLVLSEISKLEKLEVTPQELEIRLQVLKGQYQDPQMQAELDKPDSRRDIASRILSEKTIQKIVDYASR